MFCFAPHPQKKFSQEKNYKLEKIFATHITDKELISLICKKLSEIKKKKINNTKGKWTKEMNT